ncbi:hypothetical protein V6N13_064501 [Hibiscus sabdariffa]
MIQLRSISLHLSGGLTWVWGYSSVLSILRPQPVDGEVGRDTSLTLNGGITDIGWPLESKQAGGKCGGQWLDWLTAD